MEFTSIIIATIIGSVGSLIGGIVLIARKNLTDTIAHILTPFAAGALLAVVFFDLLPESIEHTEELGLSIDIFFWVLGGILSFYLLERAIHWFYHHRTKVKKDDHKRPTVALIMFGDSIHNFIDGVAIALTFLANPAAGFITAFAIAAHEIPQEIGDFAVMLHEGVSRKKVLLFNLVSACFAILGATIAYSIGEKIEAFLPYALAITSGFFLYIALASLIPEIHREEKKGYAIKETVSLLLGVVIVFFAISYLHQSH